MACRAAYLRHPMCVCACTVRVAALLQRHTAVELAAVQQHAAMRSPSPDGGKSARPAAGGGGGGGGGATARGSGLGPGALALLSSRRAGGHAAIRRGAGSVLPMRAKSSLDLLRIADTRGLVTALRQVPGHLPAAEHSLATAADPGPRPADLLPPRASDPFPDFIYMAGAMPRLQSRYAAKRPVPAAAAAQQQVATASDAGAGAEQGPPTNSSRAGSRGGPRLPDPLAVAAEGGEGEASAPDREEAEPGPASPLWQDSAPSANAEDEASEEPDSPRGWAARGPHNAAVLGGQLTGGDLSAGGIPVHAWGGEGDSSGAAGRQLSLPHPAETRSYNTHDGSR